MQFTKSGATIETINLPTGRMRFGVVQLNVQGTSSGTAYPRIALDGAGAQASFSLLNDAQATVCVPFATGDISKSTVVVRGWNSDVCRAFESLAWWCVGINW